MAREDANAAETRPSRLPLPASAHDPRRRDPHLGLHLPPRLRRGLGVPLAADRVLRLRVDHLPDGVPDHVRGWLGEEGAGDVAVEFEERVEEEGFGEAAAGGVDEYGGVGRSDHSEGDVDGDEDGYWGAEDAV